MIGAYPTLRAGVLIAGGAPLAILLAAFAPGLWPLGPAWSGALLLLALLDALIAGKARRIDLVAPASSELGSDVRIGIEAELAAQVPIGQAEASLAVTSRIVPGGRAFAKLQRSGPHPELRGEFALSPVRRGSLEIERLWLRWQGPLGLGWRQETRATAESVAILPDMATVSACLKAAPSLDLPTRPSQALRASPPRAPALRHASTTSFGSSKGGKVQPIAVRASAISLSNRP